MPQHQGSSTSDSLLSRLKIRPVDSSAWREFTGRYGPMIRRWCRRRGLNEADVQDVSQDVLTKVVRAFKTFAYDPRRGFRRWLYTICRHALYDYRRRWRQPARGTGDSFMMQVLANQPAADNSCRSDGDEYDMELFEHAMANVRARVADHNWQAFVLSMLEGRTVEETAQALGLHTGMVYVARCKITKMLSREIRRLQSASDAEALEPASNGHDRLSRSQ
jgi:RNA polymerase sigma-70 factor (ECF subfamily)